MKKLLFICILLHTTFCIHTREIEAERPSVTDSDAAHKPSYDRDTITQQHMHSQHTTASNKAYQDSLAQSPMRSIDSEQPQINITAPHESINNQSFTTKEPMQDMKDTSQAATKTTSALESAFDFDAMKAEDQSRENNRAKEEQALNERWDAQDKAAQELRDQESFAMRLFKKMSSDGATDEEIEKARNKVVLDLNKERMFEDFKIKAERFNTFKETYKDFAAKKPFDGLLALNDMNTFVSKSYGERRQMLNDIKEILNDPEAFSKFGQEDMAALKDLIRLVKFHDPDGTTIPDSLMASIQQIPMGKQNEIKQALIDALRKSTEESLAKFESFNEGMESLEQIKDLKDLQDIKAASIAGTVALGTAATVAFVAQPHLAGIVGIMTNFESLAIGSKLGLIIHHVSGAKEAELAVEVQNAVKEQFAKLTPTGTRLIDARKYKNNAKGLGQRIKEADQRLSNHDNVLIKNSYKAGKAIVTAPVKILQGLGKGVKWLSDSTGLSKAASKVTDVVSQGVSTVTDSAKKLYQGTKNVLMPKTALREQHQNRYNRDGNLIDNQGNEVLYKGQPVKKGSSHTAYEKIRDDYDLTTKTEQPESNRYKKDSHIAKGINWVKDRLGLSNKPATQPTNTDFQPTVPDKPLPSDPLLAQYAKEDAELKANRAEEDRLRDKIRNLENKHHATAREEQTWSERFVKRLMSDHAADEEITRTRNKTIVEINKRRIAQDFTIKAKRFKKFTEDHPEFSKQAPFDKLLELGDMNAFTSMSEQDREKLLQDLSESVAKDITPENVNNLNPKALDDLINLLNFTSKPENRISQQDLQAKIAELENVQPIELRNQKEAALKAEFAQAAKKALQANVKKLQRFHKGMQHLDKIDDLNGLRKIKDVSMTASVTLGFAALGTMATHADIAIAHIAITTEKLGIGAKATFVISEVAASKEAQLTRAIQDEIKNMFLELSPTSTDLLDTQHYHNTAKGPMDRISNNKYIGGTYRNVRDAIAAPFQAVGWAGGKVIEATAKAKDAITDALTPATKKAKDDLRDKHNNQYNEQGNLIDADGNEVPFAGKPIKRTTKQSIKAGAQRVQDALTSDASRNKEKARHDKTRDEFSLAGGPTQG